MTKKLLLTTVTCASALAITSHAEDLAAPPPGQDGWNFALGVPGWFAGINGNATIRGNARDVNVDFNQIKEHLQSAFGLDFAAQKGKWGFMADATYLKLTASSSGPEGFTTADASLKFFVGDAVVAYQLIKTDGEQPTVLNAVAGLRYWQVGTSMAIRDSQGQQVGGSAYYNVPDPIIGFRGSQSLTGKLHLDAQLDGGGFCINNRTDWTWGAEATLAYDFTHWFTLAAGYQALALDESKDGSHPATEVNLILNGVLVEATFKF